MKNFSITAPTYTNKAAVPTKVLQYYSNEKLPGLNKSLVDIIREAQKSVGRQMQESKLDLVVTTTVGKGGKDQPMTVHVSLEDSIISCGGMVSDQDDKRGYFQDLVEVEMFLSSDKTNQLDDFRRVSDGPQTVNGSGGTSSSVSVSFSVSGSASVGFFGETPTGGASLGASFGVTNSHSFSKNLSDFKAINYSEQHLIKHTYKMAESSGGAYLEAKDLVPSGEDMNFFDTFKGVKLHRPPDLAVSNMPLISQAIWQATSNKEFDEQIYAIVKVTQRVVLVEGQNNFTSVNANSSGVKVVHWHLEPIHLKPFNIEGGDNAIEL